MLLCWVPVSTDDCSLGWHGIRAYVEGRWSEVGAFMNPEDEGAF